MKPMDTNSCPDCRELADWAAEFVDGEMSPEARRELLLHIQSCRECAELLRSMKRLVHYCTLVPNCEVPQSVHQQLWFSIRREISYRQETAD